MDTDEIIAHKVTVQNDDVPENGKAEEYNARNRVGLLRGDEYAKSADEETQHQQTEVDCWVIGESQPEDALLRSGRAAVCILWIGIQKALAVTRE